MTNALIIEKLLAVLIELGWKPPVGDWVDAFLDDDVMTTDQAAYSIQRSAQTVRRRAAEAQARVEPIGVLIARDIWLISRRRWLDDIERRDGELARKVAEARMSHAKKCKNERAAPKFDTNERAATG
jgi:hypothetical protein